MSLTKSKIYPVLVILMCAGFLFYKYILQVYPGVMTHQLMQEFNLNGVGLGNLAANYFYAYLITQLFVGVLLDKFSSRYLTSFAILMGAAGAILFSQAQVLGQAQFGRILIGFASAFATVSYLKNTALWFKPKHFAFVGGLLATAAMLGAIFGEAPLAILIENYGWRSSVFMIGVVGIVFAVLVFSLLRDKKVNLDKQVKYGASLKDFVNVLKNKQNWLLTFYSGLTFTPLAVFGGLWGNPFLVTVHHITTTQAASLISFSFLGFGLGSPILGLVSDRIGKRKPVMYCGTLLSLITISCVIYIHSLSFVLMALLLFCFGLGIGAFMLCFALGRDSNALTVTATVMAMINTGDSLFGSFTEPCIGKILDLHGHTVVNGVYLFSDKAYQLGLSLLPLYLFIGLLILATIKSQPVTK